MTEDYIQMGIAYKKYHDRLIELGQKYFFLYFKTIKLRNFNATDPTYFEDELSIEEVDEDGEYATVQCDWKTYYCGESSEEVYRICFDAEELACEDDELMINEKVAKATAAIVEKQKQEEIRKAKALELDNIRKKEASYQQYLKLKKEFEGI